VELVCTLETYDWLVLCVGCSACGLTSVSTCSQSRERELEFGERPSWKSGALSATTREREREKKKKKNTSLWVCVCVARERK